MEELDRVGYKKKRRGISCLFIVFIGNFSSFPKAFVGDSMFPVKAWFVIWEGRNIPKIPDGAMFRSGTM
jgi:hypothetical protein